MKYLVFLLVTVSVLSGCTEPQPKFHYGDKVVITRGPGKGCHGHIINGWPGGAFPWEQWEYVIKGYCPKGVLFLYGTKLGVFGTDESNLRKV